MARRMDDILDAIRSLPKEERARLVDQLQQELADQSGHTEEPIDSASIIGLFADEPDLIEAVCEAALQSRERDPLRLSRG